MFDHASPIGEVVVASPTYYRLSAEFHGRAAHAGIRPEAGRSAIVAAAHAVAAMPHGRIDDRTTANVGSIHGGVGVHQRRAERCRLLAEARSLDSDRVEAVIAEMVDAVHDGAAHAECDVDVDCERLFDGYRQKPSSPPRGRGRGGAARLRLRADAHRDRRRRRTPTRSRRTGFTCVNLANGTEHNHEPTERVSVVALEGMLDVAFALLDACAEQP